MNLFFSINFYSGKETAFLTQGYDIDMNIVSLPHLDKQRTGNRF